jgi:branched-chain amino acid transport system substrate-binding protein
MRRNNIGRRLAGWIGLAVFGLLASTLLGTPEGMAKEYVVGLQTDRSGPTANVGAFVGDGYQDYMKLANKQQLFGPGNTVRVSEIDHSYDVPKGMESFARHMSEGALIIGLFGTPQTVALAPKLQENKIPGTSPGFGSSASRDGQKPEFNYLFPVAASYWSQAAAGVKFIMDNWKDTSRKPKIAYLYYDNPAGRDPLPILADLQKQIGFELKTYAVPPPGVEMGPQVLEIARQYKADWVLTHLFGPAPAVSIKEFQRVGFPRNRMVSFVWGDAESNLQAAGWDAGEGYYGIQFAGVGENFDVIRQIKQMYKDEGKPEPKGMQVSVYYNRGVLVAAVHAKAIINALKKHGPNITPTDVKEGLESIKDFSLGGMLPPLNITAHDHEGGGWVQVYQVQKGKFVPVTDWYQGYPNVLEKEVYGK